MPRSSRSRRSRTSSRRCPGEIVEVNAGLADSPEKVNQDPYGEGWMVKIRLSDASEVDQLMDVNAYRELLQSGS